MVNLLKDKNERRLKDRIPEKKKYVIYNYDLNAFIKAPFGVVTALPDDPYPVFNNSQSSESLPTLRTIQHTTLQVLVPIWVNLNLLKRT